MKHEKQVESMLE